MKINMNFIKTVIFGILLTAPLNGLASAEPQQKETPPVLDIPQKDDPFQDKVLGCILWSAVGDSLGRITERYWMSGLGYNKRTINDFSDFRKEDYINGVAIYTDDTQMAKRVLEVLLKNDIRSKEIPKSWHPIFSTYKDALKRATIFGSKNPAWNFLLEAYQPKGNDLGQLEKTMGDIALKFVEWVDDPDGGKSPHRAPGIGCIDASNELKALSIKPETGRHLKTSAEVLLAWVPIRQTNWWTRWWTRLEKGTEGGCGSVMRAYPFGLIFWDNPEKAAGWAAAHSLLTHRAPIATASCAAMAVGVALALQDKSPEIITEKMIEFAKKYDTETATMMKKAVTEAKKKPNDVEVKKYLTSLEGKLAHQAISAAIYLLTCFPDNPFKTIQLAVNAYGDTDSMAAMAGALVGARTGAKSLFVTQNYKNWLEPLEDRVKLINLGKQFVIEARSQ